MKKLLLFFAFLFLSVQWGFGQNSKVPRDLGAAVLLLHEDCPDSLKAVIKGTGGDSLIYLSYPQEGDYKTVFKWTDSDNRSSKRFRRYFVKNGIAYPNHQRAATLVAFKHSLLGEGVDEQRILDPYRQTELVWAREDELRFVADSLRGVYIPTDLEDCFRQIDGFWADSIKMQIASYTEEAFGSNAHLGFGMWMRNDWQFWRGSRLSSYFNELGIYHPDDMSGIILTSYHRYLSGKEIKLQEQVAAYQEYWRKMKEQDKKK